MEGSNQGPFLFVSPSGQRNKYTVNYCKDYCDQQFNDCTGFIKTSSGCKFMSNVSRCTGYGSGSLNYYVRNYTKYVTNAPTPEPTASPTSPTIRSPTEAPTDSPTRYYGQYILEWSGRKTCMEGSNQGPFLFVSLSWQKNKYTVNYCKDYCDQQFNDCTGFIKTPSTCKFMSNVSRCTGYGSGSLNYYVRNYTKYVTEAPTPDTPPALSTGSPTRYYGQYILEWSGRKTCMEGSNQGPFLFVSPSGQRNKYTVNYCKDYCDQQFNDCTGFIKTPSTCKFMSNVSRCTGYGSGSLNYYVRNYTKYVTNAPTPEPTASPTSPTTWSPTEAPTDSPTRYYGQYILEWSGRKTCMEGSNQGPFLFVSPSWQKEQIHCQLLQRLLRPAV